MLTAFLELISGTTDGEDPAACTLQYADVPRDVTRGSLARTWKRQSRVAGNDQSPQMTGHVPRLSPATGDVHFMWKLLYGVRKLYSFTDLRSWSNMVYPNVKAACLAQNVLSSEDSGDSAMEEANLLQAPTQLRACSRAFPSITMNLRDCSSPILWVCLRLLHTGCMRVGRMHMMSAPQ